MPGLIVPLERPFYSHRFFAYNHHAPSCTYGKLPIHVTSQLKEAQNVKYIDLSCNGLLSLEDENLVQNPRSVHSLFLHDNNLDRVPSIVERLPNLKVLVLSNNPRITELPAYIFERSWFEVDLCSTGISRDQTLGINAEILRV